METKAQLQNDPLWIRLQHLSLDHPDADFPFSKKLAEQENWTEDFTEKAIEEYKKFIYLCCTLPTGASPGETIDRVWHLHLTYTQHYWEEFCPEILHRKLHHHPSGGGKDETERHRKWFEETVKSYQEIFRQPPPEEIWQPLGKNIPAKKKLQFTGKLVLAILILPVVLYGFLNEYMGLIACFSGIAIMFIIVGIIRRYGNNANSSTNGSSGIFFFTCGGDSSCDDGGSSSGCGSSCGSSCGGGCGGCGGGD